jgi:class 3 adenylate cyclase
MAKLSARERANLPDRAFAYIAADGRRSLPINDEAHVRNALARFDRVPFESDAARDRARRRLLNAAKKYGIMPVGFVAGQLRSERSSRTPDFSAFPTGSVTFLLADIEGSTALLRHLEDGYAAVLKEVRGIIRSGIRHCRGYKVDAHGDEFFAVFERPHDAVQAAIDIQRAIGGHGWPAGPDVRVRIGIHSGRPTLTDSGYVGLSVHAVARICSVAHGGQIVISDRTRDGMGTRMPAEIRLRNLGRHHLIGLPKQEALYQVEAKGLRIRFPPLRTAARQ